MFYRVVETYLFDTCTLKCGYCWLAETGRVLDGSQLDRFRDPAFIDGIARFFNSRTTATERWTLQLTGGEPLLMPNLPRLCRALFECGNRVIVYSGLEVPENHPNFRFLVESTAPDIDYIMASLHPESEQDEPAFFRKLEALKNAGHRVFLRFVGHPARLNRLADLERKAKDLDVCFYPTTLLSRSYPRAYTDSEREQLSGYFTSLSQYVGLEGGVDTRTASCYAGNRVLAVNLQTGDITPCITVSRPSLGNVFEDRLSLTTGALPCPEPGVNCLCEIHFQQDVVVGVSDSARFESMKHGFHSPVDYRPEIASLRASGVGFYANPKSGMGDVEDESRLFLSVGEVKRRAKTNGFIRIPYRLGPEVEGICRLDDYSVSDGALVQHDGSLHVTTPAGKWHYALLFPIDTSALVRLAPVVFRLHFSVECGEIGFGVVGPDGSRYLVPERRTERGATECEIVVEGSSEPCWLVARNVSGSGASAIRLDELRVHRALRPHVV